MPIRGFRSSKDYMRGHSYPIVYGSYGRRGAGIGSIFSSLFSHLVPVVKTALGIGRRALASPAGQQLAKAAKRSAMQAGLNLVGNTLQGEDVATSAKREIAKARQTMGHVIKNLNVEQTGKKRVSRPFPRLATMRRRPRGTGAKKKRVKNGRRSKKVRLNCKVIKKKKCRYGVQFLKKKKGKKGKAKYRDIFDF